MIYDFTDSSFNDLPFLDWQKNDYGFETTFVKNGRKHTASLIRMESSYKMKVERNSDKMIMLEIRVRTLDIEEVMAKAEYYLISGI
jgi:hypothetical protein